MLRAMKAQWRPVGSYLAMRRSGLLLHVPTHLHTHEKVWLCSRRGTGEFAGGHFCLRHLLGCGWPGFAPARQPFKKKIKKNHKTKEMEWICLLGSARQRKCSCLCQCDYPPAGGAIETELVPIRPHHFTGQA